MTEFAMVLPLFVLLVVGLLAFGRIFFYWIEANHLASETARWAVVDRNPYSTSLQQHAAQSATAEFAGDARACITFPDGSAAVGNRVLVKVEKPFGLKLRLPGFSPVDMTVMIRGSSTMRIERFANGTGPPVTYANGQYPVNSFPAGQCP
jgi:hypothetical protein